MLPTIIYLSIWKRHGQDQHSDVCRGPTLQTLLYTYYTGPPLLLDSQNRFQTSASKPSRAYAYLKLGVAFPITLLRTKSRMGNNVFNQLIDGIGLAARRDLEASSRASGFTTLPKLMTPLAPIKAPSTSRTALLRSSFLVIDDAACISARQSAWVKPTDCC
jgi:hypothetical protein